ncbi:MAG: SDR family NAD(P)-dependent oxidoreductase [Gemmatimonadota bacterium]|nr:SDR family NAD(P)-dependent oxidoreductase [Gemmatimonadota bacterium]
MTGAPQTDAPLAGRTALITGASRGIGAATARALANAGARLALVARGEDALHAVARACGEGHLVVAADCTRADDVARLASAVTEWAGGAPDILINNAGIYPRATLVDQDPDEFAATLTLNLAAPFRVLHAFLAPMRTRGSGHVVSIGTVADRNIWPMNGAYSASKYGLRALHEVLYAEARGSGVRATLIAPGAVDTDIWQAHEAELGKSLSPRHRMLRPDDVARAVLYAVSQPPHMNVHELRLSPA